MVRSLLSIALAGGICWAAMLGSGYAEETGPQQSIDPASWGGDHVGKPLPEYVTGDECLSCHREVGESWPENRHTLTVRALTPDDDDLAQLRDVSEEIVDSVSHLMGRCRVTRFLKRSKQYGKLDLLRAKLRPNDEPMSLTSTAWETQTFADRCAGCHATAVDTKTKSFAAIAIDCVACHGSVDLAHTNQSELVLLSSNNQDPREVISICGQCHLRGGESKSSGLPWPNTFLAGDNLFRDFKVDFSDSSIRKMNPIDRHIFENARDVALFGRSETTCLTCHDVHARTSEKHQALNSSQRCHTCHVAGTDNAELTQQFWTARGPLAHNRICDY